MLDPGVWAFLRPCFRVAASLRHSFPDIIQPLVMHFGSLLLLSLLRRLTRQSIGGLFSTSLFITPLVFDALFPRQGNVLT